MKASRVVMGSTTSFVADAFREANRTLFNGALPLDERRTVKRVYRELARLDRESFDALYPQLEALATHLGLQSLATRLRSRYTPSRDPQPGPLPLGLDWRHMLTLDAAMFGVYDVHAAARVADSMLGPYRHPSQVKTYRTTDKLVSRGLRWIGQRIVDRTH